MCKNSELLLENIAGEGCMETRWQSNEKTVVLWLIMWNKRNWHIYDNWYRSSGFHSCWFPCMEHHAGRDDISTISDDFLSTSKKLAFRTMLSQSYHLISHLQLVEILSSLIPSNVSATGHFASLVPQRGTACRQTFELLLLWQLSRIYSRLIYSSSLVILLNINSVFCAIRRTCSDYGHVTAPYKLSYYDYDFYYYHHRHHLSNYIRTV